MVDHLIEDENDDDNAGPAGVGAVNQDAPLDGDADAEAPDQDDANDDDQGAAEADNFGEPQTLKDFQALRGEYQNSWNLCGDLYQDRDLQKRLRLIAMCLHPLEAEFYRDIEQQGKKQEELAAWAADRTAGSWQRCIVETLQLMHDPELFRRLGLMDGGTAQPDDDHQWVREELQWAKLAFNLIVEIASSRAWSQMMFSIMLPNMTAGLLATSEQRRTGTLNVMRILVNALMEAEKNTHIPGLRKVLDDIAFHKLQLVRELIQILKDW